MWGGDRMGTETLDLSRPVMDVLAVYPGSPRPLVEPLASLERDGFIEHRLVLTTHTGTHVDAPAHLLQDGPGLPLVLKDRWVGRAITLDLRGHVGPIGPEDLERVFPGGTWDYILLATGWKGPDGLGGWSGEMPGLGKEGAEFLLPFCHWGLGVDTLSLDAGCSGADLPAHAVVLGGGRVIVEGLTGLERTLGGGFTLVVAPLSLAVADGAPARVLAIRG